MSPSAFLRRVWSRSSPGGSRPERIARLVGAVLLAGCCLALLAAWLGRPTSSGQVIELVARQPAAGGWSRDRIVVNRGERVRLRIRSDDVVHGFAIGRLGVDFGPIEPGKTVSVEFVANQAGEFTFYCTMWCDPNHARMRGTLEVRDPEQASAVVPSTARDAALQDLDMPREAAAIPSARPSTTRGQVLYANRCVACHEERGQGTARGPAIDHRERLQDMSPVEVFRMLGGATLKEASHPLSQHTAAPARAGGRSGTHGDFTRRWSDQERWDAVAYVWSLGTTPDRVDLGRRLFSTNCAACHGERGAGDGPGGRVQPKQPANLTNPRTMLAGTGSLFLAKIRRGGMGTGMPYWGNIFSEEELAALVDYLWTFSLGTPEQRQAAASP